MSAVVVAFGASQRYEFRVASRELAAADENGAQRWLDDEWTALGCQPLRPSSKILVLDKILGVARSAGEERFAENGAWAQTFARTVGRLLDRPVVLVDVAANQVG